MPNTVSGSVIHILPEQTGAGKNGTWRKRDFVIETKDQYPKKICMTQWGDEIDNSSVSIGQTVTAHIDIASREYNGRWYTDVKAWKIELGDSDGFIEEGNAAPVSKKTPPPLVDVDDDLPF
jgi:hypothetical protein